MTVHIGTSRCHLLMYGDRLDGLQFILNTSPVKVHWLYGSLDVFHHVLGNSDNTISLGHRKKKIASDSQ